jgi:DNA-binding response OmpR family regulator
MSMRVLVIEDDHKVMEALRLHLKAEGFESGFPIST